MGGWYPPENLPGERRVPVRKQTIGRSPELGKAAAVVATGKGVWKAEVALGPDAAI